VPYGRVHVDAAAVSGVIASSCAGERRAALHWSYRVLETRRVSVHSYTCELRRVILHFFLQSLDKSIIRLAGGRIFKIGGEHLVKLRARVWCQARQGRMRWVRTHPPQTSKM